MILKRAEFEIIEANSQCVIIQDLDGYLSVTNDVENVWVRMSSTTNISGRQKRLFYFDSYGESAEIVDDQTNTIDIINIHPLPYKTVEEIKEYACFGALS